MQKPVCTAAASVPALSPALKGGKIYVICLKYCELGVIENPPVSQSTAIIIYLPV